MFVGVVQTHGAVPRPPGSVAKRRGIKGRFVYRGRTGDKVKPYKPI